MYNVVVEVNDDDDDKGAEVKVPLLEEGVVNAKASQEGTFDETNRSKTVAAVAVAALITELILLLLLILEEKVFVI